MDSATLTGSVDGSQWSASEKEPFLLDQPIRKHHGRNLIVVVAIWLASHLILLTIFGGILIFTVKDTIIEASFFGKYRVSPNKVTKFGGLPVQHDDLIGPYVTCESTGSPSAALEAGCKFDLFSNGWTPSPCFDAVTHDYFLNKHDYYFWEDEEKQHRVHQETLMEGKLDHPELWVSFQEHYEHCRYLLNITKRYSRDPTVGVLDIHLDEEHMGHCIDFLAESRDPYHVEEDVVAIFGYKKCYLPRLHFV